MLTTRVIPCLDVKDDRVVKGIMFSGLRDAGDPCQLAIMYETQGADEIIVLDVSATNRKQKTQITTIQKIRALLSIPLTVGGGVQNIDDVRRLTDAGADRVSVNTAAVANPNLVFEMAKQFGCQCTVVAIDACRKGDGWELVTHAGTNRTGQCAIQWARQVEALGAGEILLTSFDRDGTGSGYDISLIESVSSRVKIPVIASGGAKKAAHMDQALRAGATAVLAASILHDECTTVASLKLQLKTFGRAVRL